MSNGVVIVASVVGVYCLAIWAAIRLIRGGRPADGEDGE